MYNCHTFQVEEFKKIFSDEKFLVGPILHNGYQTVILLPDGSGEGRKASIEGDKLRRQFLEWLGKINCYWVHVSFGDLNHKLINDEVYMKVIH